MTFRSPAYSDITLFGDIALLLLERMGHSPTVPGALAAEDVGLALEQLRAALSVEGGLAAPAPGNDDDSEEVRVSLAQRAYPVVQLLQAALRAETYVMWEQV